jgi:hypothetical protein
MQQRLERSLTRFTCFTGTKSTDAVHQRLERQLGDCRYTQFTFFADTKVLGLLGQMQRSSGWSGSWGLNLLALLVQKYKY